jgi:hypothetical protein
VEANQQIRIVKFTPRQVAQQTLDVSGRASSECVLSGFEIIEKGVELGGHLDSRVSVAHSRALRGAA